MSNSSSSAIGLGIALCEGFEFPWKKDSENWVSLEGWWFYSENNRGYYEWKEVKKLLEEKPIPVKVIYNGGEGCMQPVICIASTVRKSDWDEIETINPCSFFKYPIKEEIKNYWNFINMHIKPLIDPENYVDGKIDLCLEWHWVNTWW